MVEPSAAGNRGRGGWRFGGGFLLNLRDAGTQGLADPLGRLGGGAGAKGIERRNAGVLPNEYWGFIVSRAHYECSLGQLRPRHIPGRPLSRLEVQQQGDIRGTITLFA